MSNYLDSLNNIAEAIQEAEGSTKAMKVADMPNRIKALGGSAKPVVLRYNDHTDAYSTEDYAKPELAPNPEAGYQYGVMWLSISNEARTVTSAKDFLAAVLADPQKISVVNLPEYDYHKVYTVNPFTNYEIVSIDLLDNLSLAPLLGSSRAWVDGYVNAAPNSFAVWFDTYDPGDGSTYQRRAYLCVIVTLSGGDSSDSSY